MARAALGWNTKDLGKRAHVSGNTVVRFENERNEPNPATMLAIRNAFEAAGIKFLETGGIEPPKRES
jgi:DNA-binding XRE family transcriptional regulator